MVVRLLLVLMLARFPAVVWEDNDRKTIPEPKEIRIANAYDFMVGSFGQPAAQLLDVPRNIRKLARKPKEALNVNAMDEAPNSSWFTNRIFMDRLTPQDIYRGPDGSNGPDPSGPWIITKCKTDGVSPGIRIKDRNNQTYLLKFDVPEYPELSTAADVIGSRFFYAAGYNVPQNSIVTFDRRRLVPKEDLKCNAPDGRTFALKEGGLEHLLENVARTKDGLYRAMSSKFLEGTPKGPFSYLGVRPDDPNDRVAHEHRRELRGLKVLASFINHTDIKRINTLDTYVEQDGKKFLRHNFIDFGATLGSATRAPKEGGESHEYMFDTGEVLKSVLTLGVYHRAEDRPIQLKNLLIGYIEGDDFDPPRWKPNYPIASFENMTDRDGYWGAKIVASFADDEIAAAVRAGRYTDPTAERLLTDILKQRRDRIAGYWFRRVAPLDRFHVDGNRLSFDDLALTSRLDNRESVRYDVVIRTANHAGTASGLKAGTPITVDVGDEPTEIRIARSSKGWPDQTVTLYLQRVDGIPSVVGIQR